MTCENIKVFIKCIDRVDKSMYLHLISGYGHQYNMKHKTESGLEYMPEGFEHVTFFNEDD